MDKITLITTEQGLLILQLIIAHIIGDFVLQTNSIARKKNWNNHYMGLHIFIIFLVNIIFTQIWLLSLILSGSHYIIDVAKQLYSKRKNAGVTSFVLDQLTHLIIIFFIWSLYSKIGFVLIEKLGYLLSNYNLLLIIAGYLFVIYPTGYLIGYATKKQSKQEQEKSEIDKGGKIIGIFERIIILTLVLLNQYEAIGFLITGKSIIRFADKNSTIKSEYVLIGTMMSYAIAILTGVLINYSLQ